MIPKYIHDSFQIIFVPMEKWYVDDDSSIMVIQFPMVINFKNEKEKKENLCSCDLSFYGLASTRL